jgi:hypothetical protein
LGRHEKQRTEFILDSPHLRLDVLRGGPLQPSAMSCHFGAGGSGEYIRLVSMRVFIIFPERLGSVQSIGVSAVGLRLLKNSVEPIVAA